MTLELLFFVIVAAVLFLLVPALFFGGLCGAAVLAIDVKIDNFTKKWFILTTTAGSLASGLMAFWFSRYFLRMPGLENAVTTICAIVFCFLVAKFGSKLIEREPFPALR